MEQQQPEVVVTGKTAGQAAAEVELPAVAGLGQYSQQAAGRRAAIAAEQMATAAVAELVLSAELRPEKGTTEHFEKRTAAAAVAAAEQEHQDLHLEMRVAAGQC